MSSPRTSWTGTTCRPSTADPCASTSRRCTATSRSSGWTRSRSSTASSPATGSNRATTSTAGSGSRTVVTTSRQADVERAPTSADATTDVLDAPVVRFDRVERVVHWCNATLFGVLMLTGAALYAGPISTLVGRRELVRTIHVYSGLALPVPLLVGLCLRAGRQLRADVRAEPLDPRRLALAVLVGPRHARAARQVQPGAEAERDVRRRGDRGHARDGVDHELVQPVPHRLPHRRGVRARLVRAGAVAGRHRSRVARVLRPRRPPRHDRRVRDRVVGPAPPAPLVRGA